MKYNDPDRIVNYRLGIGYPTAEHQESQKLGDIINPEDLEEMTEEEVSEYLTEDQQQWANNYLDSGWYFEDEE